MIRSLSRVSLSSIVVACLALLLALGVQPARAADFDPQSILGEWQGTWAMAQQRSATGNYYLTIKKVEGDKVQGRSERPASGKTPESNWNFAGTLAGNVLTIKTGELAMEMTINGNSMTGWSLIRGNRFDINLIHK